MNRTERIASYFRSKRHRSVLDWFWEYVDKRPDGCWLWAGSVNKSGYGVFTGRGIRAHRFAWEVENRRQVPDGLELHHECKNKRCVNPTHLRACTHQENVLAECKDRCKHGHAFTPENTKINSAGARVCRECRRLNGVKRRLPQRRRKAERREQRAAERAVIRGHYESGMTQAEIVRLMGVSSGHVSKVVRHVI